MFEINKNKLILAIAKTGYTAKEIAKVTGISQTTISRFKAGTQKARPQTINKLAKALNVEIEDLI